MRDAPTLTALLTATSDTNPDVDTSAETSSSPSSVPTAFVIRITASPPAATSNQAVLPKLPYHREINILYLVPLFIALGVMLGIITAVILLKWRRRLLHTPLLPGPPYVPPENDVEDRLPVHGHPSMEQVSLLAVGTPSKYTVHGSRYTPKQIPAWKALDTTHSRSTYIHTIIPSSDGERFTVLTQEDPFHVPPSVTAMQQSPSPSNDVSTIRIIPSLPNHVSGNNATHRQVQDTSLPKPFRRSMFDILKLKDLSHTIPPLRKAYTVIGSDDEPAGKASASRVQRVTSLKVVLPAGGSRFRNTRRSLDGHDPKQGSMDGPAVYPQQSQHVDDGISSSLAEGGKVTPFTVESRSSQEEEIRNKIDEVTHSDIYMKAPQRRHSRRLCRTPPRSISRYSSVPDMHASVLPLSPPLLMSPPLEKSLFFTTSLASSASLAAHMNSLVALDPSLRLVGESPVTSPFSTPSKKTKEARTPRSSRPGSPLPYPSYPDQDRVQPTSVKPYSVNTKRRTSTPHSPSPKGRFTNATRRESAMGVSSLGSLSPTSLVIALAASSSSDMLSKVNDIVAQGYTKRRSSSVGGREYVGTSDPIW